MTIREVSNKKEWDEHVLTLQGHPLQLWGWGELKATGSWQVRRVVVENDGQVIGGAQILIRHLPWPFRRLSYVPRGPFGSMLDSSEAMQLLADYARKTIGGTHLAIDPDVTTWRSTGKWRRSKNNFLVKKTLLLNLTQSEETLQQQMSKKTWQHIRRSSRREIEIKRMETPEEIARVLAVYRDTANRAKFALHDDDYYQNCTRYLGKDCYVYAVLVEGEVTNFVWTIASKRIAFELYGGMNDVGRKLRTNYALKWHIIQEMKRLGVMSYDMNGLLNDGISTFKRSFSDHDTDWVGTYDYPFSPLYGMWSTLLPGGKKIVQKIKSLLK